MIGSTAGEPANAAPARRRLASSVGLRDIADSLGPPASPVPQDASRRAAGLPAQAGRSSLLDHPRHNGSTSMLRFLKENLWWWLTPILVVLLLLVGVLLLSKDSAIAPFIYSIF